MSANRIPPAIRPITLVALMAGSVVCGPALCAVTVLKCHLSDGTPRADIVLDIESRQILQGTLPYKITKITDLYITAIQASVDIDAAKDDLGGLGGGVFVINRVTGVYIESGVDAFCESESSCGVRQVRSYTSEGLCKKPEF